MRVAPPCGAGAALAAAVLAAPGPAWAEAAPSDDCAVRAETPLVLRGCAVLDDFLRAFNARDAAAWAATLNYPHVRVAGGEVLVWQSPAAYARDNDLRKLAATGWSHSRWDYRHVVQSAPDKLHFVVQFTRYGADDRPLGSYPSLYVVTLKDGHWGVQARSSFAGLAAKGSAF